MKAVSGQHTLVGSGFLNFCLLSVLLLLPRISSEEQRGEPDGKTCPRYLLFVVDASQGWFCLKMCF